MDNKIKFSHLYVSSWFIQRHNSHKGICRLLETEVIVSTGHDGIMLSCAQAWREFDQPMLIVRAYQPMATRVNSDKGVLNLVSTHSLKLWTDPSSACGKLSVRQLDIILQ